MGINLSRLTPFRWRIGHTYLGRLVKSYRRREVGPGCVEKPPCRSLTLARSRIIIQVSELFSCSVIFFFHPILSMLSLFALAARKSFQQQAGVRLYTKEAPFL